jgi:crossover junction endodeoxyribonuclease RuvC
LADYLNVVRPDVVALEDVFSAKNARSALALGQARGAVLAAAGYLNIPVHAYAPAKVKRAVAGYGRADKRQMQQMMRVLLSLDYLPATDEADAMAIAMCHAMQTRMSG